MIHGCLPAGPWAVPALEEQQPSYARGGPHITQSSLLTKGLAGTQVSHHHIYHQHATLILGEEARGSHGREAENKNVTHSTAQQVWGLPVDEGAIRTRAGALFAGVWAEAEVDPALRAATR